MKWLFLAAAIWYWWLLYTLSYNPKDFPDPTHAHKVWERRFAVSCCLGASIVTGSLYLSGAIHRPWITAVLFVVSAILVGLVQGQLVGLIIYSKVGLMMLKVKAGMKLGVPKLAPIVWPIYLRAEEGGRERIITRQMACSYSQATATWPRRIVFSILVLWTFADAYLNARDWHLNDAPWWLCILGFFLSALVGLWFVGVIVMVWDWIARWFAQRRSAAARD